MGTFTSESVCVKNNFDWILKIESLYEKNLRIA